jgi:hypothetical protein
MRIGFVRLGNGRSLCRMLRPDGVMVEMRDYSVKHPIAHDLVHAVTERELRLARGVFGSVLGGALFDSVRVVSGRPRHDAAARSVRLLRANSRDLTMAEVLAHAVHVALTSDGRPFRTVEQCWASLRTEPVPWEPDAPARAIATLRELGEAWQRTADGELLELDWPRGLVSPVPPAREAKAGARSPHRRSVRT